MPFDPETEPSLQRRFGRFGIGHALGGAAFLILPIALFAAKGLAPLFIVTALLAIALSVDRMRQRRFFPRPISYAAAAFVSLAGISALWSIEPASSMRLTLAVALSCFGGFALATGAAELDKSQRDFFEKALIAGGILGMVLLLIEQTSDWMLMRAIYQMRGVVVEPETSLAPSFNPGMAICALFVWPWILTIKKRYGAWPMIMASVAALIAIFLSDADAPLIASILGLVVAACSIVSRRLIIGLFAVFIVVSTVSMPFLPGALPNPETETSRYPFLSHSGLHRLSIWRTAEERIFERPVLGFGMNATRHLYKENERIRRYYDTDDPTKKSWFNNFQPIPLHTHNGILQVWLELGGVGALSLMAVFLSILHLIYRKVEGAAHTAACLGLLTSGIFIFSISFGAWQSWWQSGLWLLAGFMAAAVGGGKPE